VSEKVVSSILERTNNEPLTLELLKDHVPAVKAGKEASDALKEEKDPKKRAELLKIKNEGTKAQKVLILSALPLIKSVASKELQRRSAWSSRVSYDDILQEAIAGFIRGLFAFKLDVDIKSPTNYLGQWIMTSIRRQIEVMDHDFTIPHETVERHRRMRAVYSRLAGELKRDPTDTEFLEALNSATYAADTSKWGKVNKEASTNTKQYTQKHIEEMRDASNRTYAMQSTTPVDAESETEFELRGETLSSQWEDTEQIDKADTEQSQNKFFYNVFELMRVGKTQQDIIARSFGLAPYMSPQNVRQITEQTGYSQKFIKTVIQSFSQYMPTKGGVFHYVLVNMSMDEVDALEFSWLLPIVGEYPKGKSPILPPDILTKAK
jgi:DNA-directed RNA polymerase specialized sigma subunit